jgi:hypothetical protein
MPTTTCEISGAVYQLDYTKLASKRGHYYFGKIHSNPVTGFALRHLTMAVMSLMTAVSPFTNRKPL